MKKIAVITQGVKLQDEKGYTRFKYIAELFAKNNFKVELITSTFQHWEKKQREKSRIKGAGHPVTLVYEPGYDKNIDIKRIISHKVLARNIKRHLEEQDDYDLIYFEIPPNDVAKAIMDYACSRKIPAIADVNDLWPEAMKMVLDIPLISRLIFYPFQRDAESVYRRVSAVVGTSREYAERAAKYNQRVIPAEVVYVGNLLEEYDAGVAKYIGEIEKKEEEYWVTYAGTIGTSYDIKTLILSAEQLKKAGYENIKYKILGGGPLKESLEQFSKTLCGNVEFLGYMQYEKMAAYLTKSDILVNSFIKKAPQSIVTKIGDYMASGHPMINTCSSVEFREKVESDRIGINIEAENVEELQTAILKLYCNPSLSAELGKNARKIAEIEFDRKQSYLKILGLVEQLLNQNC